MIIIEGLYSIEPQRWPTNASIKDRSCEPGAAAWHFPIVAQPIARFDDTQPSAAGS
jgi:hypothetical protein